MNELNTVTAFRRTSKIAVGDLASVIGALHEAKAADALIFDDRTAAIVEYDLRGSREEALARLIPSIEKVGRGRPKLGVVPREVTLLPRHWEWLNAQPGGASVALRKLVENARHNPVEQIRQSREAAYKFMHAVAGDLPGYEEATRALFAGDEARFNECVISWPVDVADYARKVMGNGWTQPA